MAVQLDLTHRNQYGDLLVASQSIASRSMLDAKITYPRCENQRPLSSSRNTTTHRPSASASSK